MPILGGKLSVLRKRIEEEQSNAEAIKSKMTANYQASIEAIDDQALRESVTITIEKFSRKSTERFDKQIKKLKRQTAHLNLKTQILNIFGSLIISLLWIIISHIIFPTSDYSYTKINFQSKIDWAVTTSIFSLLLSLGFFVYAIGKIWNLVCVVVDHNMEIEIATSNTNENSIGSD